MKKINNGELREKNIGEIVTLYGFVFNKRKMGGLTFIDLRDRWGVTQVIVNDSNLSISKESVIQVTGKVTQRKQPNLEMETGQIEIVSNEIKILSEAEQLPFIIRDELLAKEDTRLQHRYLDLRRKEMANKIIMRHKVKKAFYDFLDSKDFLDIETPILSKTTPEGARDYIVPTRSRGNFFALPQSPQLYKQLLMISGFENYFQIAKSFRDEDSRKDRQPEFTQLDIETSYSDEEQIINLTEEMMEYVFEKLNINIKLPFKRMKYDDAISLYGSDKPDLRFNLKIKDADNYFENTEFNVLRNQESIRYLFVDNIITKKQAKALEEVAVKNGAKGMMWASNDNASKEGPGFKFIKNEIEEIYKDNNSVGSIIIISGEYQKTSEILGSLRNKLNEIFKYANEEEFNFTWITHWPLFEYVGGKINALHHPFTSPSLESMKTFDKEPLKAKARAYDLVLNGFELGGGSIRISNGDIQRKMFETINLSNEQINNQFGFFMEAFKYGVPPHGGIALGLDRFLMILTKSQSIRDVIAFPKNANGISVMENSPSNATKSQLDEYQLSIIDEE